MGTYAIKMPDIGEGIAEVELVQWHVKPGDMVAEEQVLADVTTDKANVEIPSHVHGKVVELNGKPGDVIAVGTVIIRLEVEGKGNVAGEEVVKKPEPKAEPKPAPPVVSPRAPASAGDGPGPKSDPDRPLAAPAVRRRAKELGIDLAQVSGSGPDGRVTQEDLEAQSPSRGASLRFNVRDPAPLGTPRTGEEQVPVIGVRRKIAEKMQESKRHIPHFAYVEEVDVTALEALREQLNKRWRSERGHLTLLPFIIRAIAHALPQFPEINARYDDEAGVLTRFAPVHMGIATQTPSGLMVPVVRNAEARDLWSCASEVARLAEAARTGKAARDDLIGSTITLTSLGPLGGIVTTPIINYPEVAIVGVNKVVERPVVREGAIVIRQVMNLSSCFDHRIVDGLRAATFVQAVRACLESPATMFID